MTASSPARPPFATIPSKTSSTAQSSQLNALADSKVTSSPRSSSRVPPGTKFRQDAAAPDPTSERATLALIRRTLVAEGSLGSDPRASPSPSTIEGILPPLTSSNEVDLQLYAIVAIIIKDFVNSWYSKISPDQTFVEEVIQIVAHCSRALEQRIREIDMTEMLLDEIPALVERHIAAYRTATTAHAALQYGQGPRRIYHALNPHPALDPTLTAVQQEVYESAYRQLLIQGALAVLLPTEDLANAALRALVSDIISDLILGQVLAQKICEPWFLHGAVSKIVEIVTSRPSPGHVSSSRAAANKSILPGDRSRSRLEKFGLLTSNMAAQKDYSPVHRQSSLSAWFWGLLQYAFIAYQTVRFILVGMAHAHHLPRRTRHAQADVPTLPSSAQQPPVASKRHVSDPDGRIPRPVIRYRLFACTSTVLDLTARMPWLGSLLGFWQHILAVGPGRYGAANSTLDKFLYHTISTRLFSSSLLPPLLLQIRAIVFPNNTLGPAAPPPPSPEEAREIRSKAASDILSLIPSSVARTFFAVRPDGTEEEIRTEVEDRILGWLDDPAMNKYLVYAILEHVVLRLVPEMREKTTSELLAERGVSFVDDENGQAVLPEKLA